MSIRIVLENPPEFYTNLDVICGHVVLSLTRPEHVGAIVVKLEGESRTSLVSPYDHSLDRRPGDVLLENHKILYKVGQVFPNDSGPVPASPYLLQPGQHRFPFQFKFPFNNICGNPEAMARIGGVVSPSGPFGISFRVMDGTRQLFYPHVTKTLPPSFTGFPGEAEIRYYLKVTVQRPSLFRENWRYQLGLKFLPIEPPRPPKTNQEAYARRPFTFHPCAQTTPVPYLRKKRTPFFGSVFSPQSNDSPPLPPRPEEPPPVPPSVEMSARLPHPAILTCNKPVPLRLIAKKLVAAPASVYLIALQVDLVGKTLVRCHNLVNTEVTRWVITSRADLSILISRPDDPVGTEFVVPNDLWSGIPLPNTVMPSFVTCNLRRDYQLEIRLGLAWQTPGTSPKPSGSSSFFFKNHDPFRQELHLPLQFSSVQVFSGLTPPPALVEATLQGRRPVASANPQPRPSQPSSPSPRPPDLPPRPSPAAAAATAAAAAAAAAASPSPQQPVVDTGLYPPEPPYDDAPPTYEEAMAEMMTGPMFPSTDRPAYSGVTDEHGPSSMPEGNGDGGTPSVKG